MIPTTRTNSTSELQLKICVMGILYQQQFHRNIIQGYNAKIYYGRRNMRSRKFLSGESSNWRDLHRGNVWLGNFLEIFFYILVNLLVIFTEINAKYMHY